jgi:hypothetical protein
MSRTITSPVKRWPGTVTLADPLNAVQFIAWRNAMKGAPDPAADYDLYCLALLPGVCACVERWDLEGLGQLSPETFPYTPRSDADPLLGVLVRELRRIVQGIDAPDPNSPPPSMAGA